jgi:hypothetical protein
MLRVDSEEKTKPLETTSLSERDYLEEDLREWILSDSLPILGEDLLIIGREVSVKNIGDAIDLIGIDRDGNLVVIELKKALSVEMSISNLSNTLRTRHTGVGTKSGSSSSHFGKLSGGRVSTIKTLRLLKFWKGSAMMSTA